MKKLLGIVVLGLFLGGCTTDPDGSKVFGQRGSYYWKNGTSHTELVKWYAQFDIDEICHEWKVEGKPDQNFRRKKTRDAMKEALKTKGEDPLICMKLENL